MFSNIGAKVKGLAVLVCIVGIICSLITAVWIWGSDISNSGIIGLIILIVGSFISWVSSWTTYAIGEAAEQQETIESVKHSIASMEKNICKRLSALEEAIANANAPVTTPIEANEQASKSTTIEVPVNIRKEVSKVKSSDITDALKSALKNSKENHIPLSMLLVQLSNKYYLAGKSEKASEVDKIIKSPDPIAAAEAYISAASKE